MQTAQFSPQLSQLYHPKIVSLASAAQTPQNEVEIGERVQQLLHLYQEQLPLPEASILTVPFLHHIFSHNNIQGKIEVALRGVATILEDSTQPADDPRLQKITKDIEKYITYMDLPDDTRKEFTHVYREWMEDHFIAIRPSFILPQPSYASLSQLHVKGEANIVESILRVWASFYQPQYLKLRWHEWQKGQYIPAALVLQRMVNSRSSGYALTLNPETGDKHQVYVSSVWGVAQHTPEEGKYADTFTVDMMTWHIVQRQTKVQTHQHTHQLDGIELRPLPSNLHIQPSLSDEEVIHIAQLAVKVQRHELEPQVVEWAIEKKTPSPLHMESTDHSTPVPPLFLLNARPMDNQEFAHLQAETYTPPAARPMTLGDHPMIPVASAVPATPTPTVATVSTASTPAAPRSTATKIYTCVDRYAAAHAQVHPQASTQAHARPHAHPNDQHADGIGLLPSEPIFLSLQEHPLNLLRKGKKQLIHKTLMDALSAYFSFAQTKPVIYRSLNFTSAEFAMLKNTQQHEPTELNPTLGYRGALRIVHNYEVFDQEVEAIVEAKNRHHVQVQLMIPFVRSSAEFALIQKHLARNEATASLAEQLWMECDTPENLLQISEYLNFHPAGLSINIKTVHALLHGIDPENSDVASLYSLDVALLKSLLKHVRAETKHTSTKVVVHLDQYNQELLDYIVELGCAGITIGAKDIARARERAAQMEEKKVSNGI